MIEADQYGQFALINGKKAQTFSPSNFTLVKNRTKDSSEDLFTELVLKHCRCYPGDPEPDLELNRKYLEELMGIMFPKPQPSPKPALTPGEMAALGAGIGAGWGIATVIAVAKPTPLGEIGLGIAALIAGGAAATN